MNLLPFIVLQKGKIGRKERIPKIDMKDRKKYPTPVNFIEKKGVIQKYM